MSNDVIRGVNLGGWLVLERYIAPSVFAITTCDTTEHPPPNSCAPSLPYPADQLALVSAFSTKSLAREYLISHWDTFVTEDDIVQIKASNLKNVRVPIGHWILDDEDAATPWVSGEWPYLIRLLGWCKKHGVKVWLDLHTTFGSQNGFDNSGQTLAKPTGVGWSGSVENVDKTLDVIAGICEGIRGEENADVVVGFGLLNEPFKGENEAVVKNFDERGLQIVRSILGPKVTVYIGDMFDAQRFQADKFWGSPKYHNTLLDSHYYHVFAAATRSFSPRQHIGYVCEKNLRDLKSCCWDGDGNKSEGMGRMMGEWSASFDTLVCDKLDDVMKSHERGGGEVLEYDREIGEERKAFLRNFVEAQMVAWESGSIGWFYWNFKMEGGAFAEWDYLRGVREGWIPTLDPGVRAEDVFGSCESIIFKTDDSMDIVDTFPDPSKVAPDWQSVEADDDVVVSHGQSLIDGGMWGRESTTPIIFSPPPAPLHDYPSHFALLAAAFGAFVVGLASVVKNRRRRVGAGLYTTIPETSIQV